MLPPDRARLDTSPVSTGFPTTAITIGIVVVACFAARAAGVPWVTMTATLRRFGPRHNRGREVQAARPLFGAHIQPGPHPREIRSPALPDSVRALRAAMSSEVCSVGRRCPLWVKSGHRGTSNQCPLYPRKRTLIKCIGKSASCQTLRRALDIICLSSLARPARQLSRWAGNARQGEMIQCRKGVRLHYLPKHGQCSRAGRFVHISAVERAGLAELKAGQIIDYEIVEERGRKRAENLRIVAQPKG